jgi:aspartate/methionine/tyrosine aminotransferase
MDSGMFYPVQKDITALKSDKSWFEGMNLIYKRRRVLTEQLAEKRFQFTRKVLDCLYGQSYHQNCTSANVYDIKSIYLSPRNNFGSNGEGYIRFALCVRKKIQEAIDRFCLSLSKNDKKDK